VVIAVKAFENQLKKMALPRVLLTPHLMGRPVGKVNDAARQKAVVLQALELLETATAPCQADYKEP